MCDRNPDFSFDHEERKDILAAEEIRRADAIRARTVMSPEEYEDVAEDNRLGNHIAGEISERAVLKWLRDNEVLYTTPANVFDEMTKRIPDVTASAHGIGIEVKSKTFKACYFPARQAKKPKCDAIMWCATNRGDRFDYDRDYDCVVPGSIFILGWCTLDVVSKAREENGEHVIGRYKLTCLATLVEWLTTGAPPQATCPSDPEPPDTV
jgi:hypothetical protein